MRRVRITWGPLVREPAVRCAGGDFPPMRYCLVYIPLEFFGRFYAVQEALAAAVPGATIFPRLRDAPASITVHDPPEKSKRPRWVEIEN